MEQNAPQTDAFFHSVAEAFARNREQAARFELVLVIIVVLLAVLQLVALIRRARGLRLDASLLAHQRGLTKDELDLVQALARAAKVDPMELLTHLDVFETTTTKALKGELKIFLEGEPLAASLRRIRHALHFDRLPAHAPLLSSRELAPGTALDVGDAHGQVTRVDEFSLTVELRSPLACAVGDALTLHLAHAREARYELTCRVLASQPASDLDRARLTLAHDDTPRRLQQRDLARVPVQAPISLHARSWPGHTLAQRQVFAELRDLSGGGAMVSSPSVLPPGVLVDATFSIAGQDFSLRAVTLSAQRHEGRSDVHLEFVGLTPEERERLIALVTRLQGAEQAAARQR